MVGVQFLYELRLAALELEALAGGAEMESDLRTFHLPPEADIAPVSAPRGLRGFGGRH